jgi:hypothetical protein
MEWAGVSKILKPFRFPDQLGPFAHEWTAKKKEFRRQESVNPISHKARFGTSDKASKQGFQRHEDGRLRSSPD